MTRAYIGLGANLGDRAAMLRAAVEQLAAEPGIEVVAVSPVRETDPVGYTAQPRFLNAAAAVETELPPASCPRPAARDRASPRPHARRARASARARSTSTCSCTGTSGSTSRASRCRIPRLHERLFALEPLLELDPQLELPGRGPLAEIVRGLQSG